MVLPSAHPRIYLTMLGNLNEWSFHPLIWPFTLLCSEISFILQCSEILKIGPALLLSAYLSNLNLSCFEILKSGCVIHSSSANFSFYILNAKDGYPF